jgi:hypothetical protein
MKLMHYGTGHFRTFAFASPDKPCNFMEGDKAIIRSMTLQIKARDTEQPLFLALNPATKPQEKGGFVVTYCKVFEMEAIEKLANIAALFQNLYSDESSERFTPEACEQADLTKWDAENDLPITLEEQDLEDVMDEEIEWIENLNTVTFGHKIKTEVILERPKRSHKTTRSTFHPTSADDDTLGTFFPGQKTATDDHRHDNNSVLTTDTNYSTLVARAPADDETS